MRRADHESTSRPDPGVGAGALDAHPALLRDGRWWTAFVLVFGLAAAWAFASPLYSVPDEPAHTVKAAAVVRGELDGRKQTVPNRPGTILRGGFTIVVHVPTSYTWNSTTLPNCYISHPHVPASCAPKFVDDHRSATWTTWVGRYPPMYYALVGWPSLVDTGTASIYAMRLLGALVFAALLAAAMACAWEAPRFRLLAVGVAVAATPTALFLAGGVNPMSLEIAAAVCLWAALGVVALGDPPGVSRRLLVLIGLSGALLAATRPISALWLAVILLAGLALAGRDRVAAVIRQRGAPVTAAVVGVVAAGGVLWTLVGGALGNAEGDDPRGLGYLSALKHSLRRTPEYMREMLGVFGWRTTPSPSVVYWVFVIVLVLLVGLALVRSSRSAATVLLGVLGVSLVLPPLLEAANAHDKGFAWQGRYGLPIAVGVPIVAALVLGASRRLGRRATARLAATVLTVVAATQAVAFYWALRRYAVGSQGPLFFFGHRGWAPPLPSGLLVAAVVVLAAGLAVLAYRLATGGPPDEADRAAAPTATRPLAASHAE
jgi:Predicted membrane protein (DUF2142)